LRALPDLDFPKVGFLRLPSLQKQCEPDFHGAVHGSSVNVLRCRYVIVRIQEVAPVS
jgi:hypothetical protein